MSLPLPPRCCPMCGGILPIPSHLGLSRSVYCALPAHWEAVGLDVDDMIEDLVSFQQLRAAFQAQRAAFREAMGKLRTELDEDAQSEPAPDAEPPNTTDDDLDEDREAKVRRLLRFLEEPPDASAGS